MELLSLVVAQLNYISVKIHCNLRNKHSKSMTVMLHLATVMITELFGTYLVTNLTKMLTFIPRWRHISLISQMQLQTLVIHVSLANLICWCSVSMIHTAVNHSFIIFTLIIRYQDLWSIPNTNYFSKKLGTFNQH